MVGMGGEELAFQLLTYKGSGLGIFKVEIESMRRVTDSVKAEPADYRPAHLHEIMQAHFEATEKCRNAAENLGQAITPSYQQIKRVVMTMKHLKAQKERYSYFWWIRKRFSYRKALRKLTEVDCKQIKINATQSLLQDFQNATQAYENVIQLCKKHSRGQLPLLLQVTYNASILDDAIKALHNKWKYFFTTARARKALMEETMRKAKCLQVDMNNVKSTLENLEMDLNHLSDSVDEAKSSRKVSTLLAPPVCDMLCKYERELLEVRDSCDELVRSLRDASASLKSK